jgi:hypothetical protein
MNTVISTVNAVKERKMTAKLREARSGRHPVLLDRIAPMPMPVWRSARCSRRREVALP